MNRLNIRAKLYPRIKKFRVVTMKLVMAISTLISVLLLASVSQAACKEAVVPELPDPDTAVMNDMLRAQAAVKQYLLRQEQYLSCVGDNFRHDAAVDKMHDVAEQYNNTARRYRIRLESMDMIVDLAQLIL